MPITDRLLPKPRKVEEKTGSWQIPATCVISIPDDASERTRCTALLLADELKTRCGVDSTIGSVSGGLIQLLVAPGDRCDAYLIRVSPDGVVVEGEDEAGLFYGTRTLLQMIDCGIIPCCEIEDYPDYRHRMVHYDLAREQTCHMDYLKQVIDRLSDHKINMLHLYLENRFQFQKHPEVSPPGVMTPEQARELDEYASQRFVELVPEVNCLAHLENALKVEKYKHLAEDQENPYEICTQIPEAVEFVKDLVTEVAACFKSVYFHMGGDEAWHMGRCPVCAERIESEGGKQGMFIRHYTHIAEYIKSLGKRPMMWGDMLLENPGVAEAMPKDIIIFDWHYGETSVDTVTHFTSHGYEVYVCPAMSGFGRLAAPYDQATNNIYKFIGEGVEGGATGVCMCAWELRLGHYFNNDYWGILLAADRAWNTDAGDIQEYEKRFCREFYGLGDLRPVEYFRELSDGYASIFADVMMPSSWVAFRISENDYTGSGAKITPEILQASDKKLAELQDMISELRDNVNKNEDTLDFADLPAYSTHMMLRKLAFLHQYDDLVEQSKSVMENDPDCADFKLLRAIGLMKALNKDLDYFELRFEDAVQRFGGSQDDVERIKTMRGQSQERIDTAKHLMSE